MAISDFILGGFLVGVITTILLFKTSPFWVASLKRLKNVLPAIQQKIRLYRVEQKAKEKVRWSEDPGLCTNCGSQMDSHYEASLYTYEPTYWGVARWCLSKNDPHYWWQRRGFRSNQEAVKYIQEIEK